MSRLQYTPFGEDVLAFLERKKGVKHGGITMISKATGIDKSKISDYFSGKKDPALTTVMRIIVALDADYETALRLVRTTGYDISDIRIPKNRIYHRVLTEDLTVNEIKQLFYEATWDYDFKPNTGEKYPINYKL